MRFMASINYKFSIICLLTGVVICRGNGTGSSRTKVRHCKLYVGTILNTRHGVLLHVVTTETNKICDQPKVTCPLPLGRNCLLTPTFLCFQNPRWRPAISRKHSEYSIAKNTPTLEASHPYKKTLPCQLTCTLFICNFGFMFVCCRI